ncbi:hypothetical protein [Dokdonella sp.]|uniref:hypothetical protein n=1 Tax=Dokdonella sp. TaxID=2291710 RepID=UPI0025C199C6|nr:hypothetical protein [Dokdonella sp.]
MRNPIPVLDACVLRSWYMPKVADLREAVRPSFQSACAALTAAITGELSLSVAAKKNNICRKRLGNILRRAPKIAPDGEPYGYRVCVPWGAYCPIDESPGGETGETAMSRESGPHAMRTFLRAQPNIAKLIEAYHHPLPSGRTPRSFDRLHAAIVTELKRLDLRDYYPLNQADQGRRALLRFIRKRRIDLAPMGSIEGGEVTPTELDELFVGKPFDRTELDAHRIDVEAVLGVELPNGGVVKRAVTTMWLIVQVETRSRAIFGWVLRVGAGYNNLDVAECLARSIAPWQRSDLTIPGLEYAPGAGMPSGMLGDMSLWRPRSVALDNALAHWAHDLEQAVARAHGARFIYGKAHEPRSRPIVEQFFSRLERGALRHVPGGFEPATRLGEKKIRISNFGPDDVPIQLHLLEELLGVIIANYNATPHPALGHLSPLQFLQMHKARAFDFVAHPDTAAGDADDMASTLVSLRVHGNRKKGVMPHVNYMYARYRSPELDQRWELVNTKVLARISRRDLRSFILMRSATTPLLRVRAAAPWGATIHDETTRTLIMRWAKLRTGFRIVGSDCAIASYVNYLKSIAQQSSTAVDQLARIDQLHNGQAPTHRPMPAAPLKIPKGGWRSLDSSDS